MTSATDLESGQGAQAAPRAGVEGSDSALPVRDAQPIVSQTETLDETSSSACCCIPSGVFRPFTSMRGGSNIDHSQRNVGDQPTQTGQGSTQAEARIPHIPFSHVELSHDPCKLQFIYPGKTLKSTCSPALALRNILNGQGGADAYKELLKNLEIFHFFSNWQRDENQRQLWRLQDAT